MNLAAITRVSIKPISGKPGIFYRRLSSSQNMREKPIESSIRVKLQEYFQPSHLEILNESGMHNVPKGVNSVARNCMACTAPDLCRISLLADKSEGNSEGSKTAGSETHFKVIIVSEKFANESLINRHRLVNRTLEEELRSGVHALSIVAKTADQWESSSKVIDKSPPCRGGAGL